jgi:(heptosyl)LPS beta-1,4-glucosyltransferase
MLSAVLCAWNEADNLPRVLSSLQGLVDEVVVVIDSQTTDTSAQVAKHFKARVFKHKHTGFVEPMRAFAISKARGDWILLLDADEQVTPGLAAYIQDAVKANSADYYELPRKNLIFNSWITSSHWWPDYVVRLFKPGKVIWHDQIHSQPSLVGVGVKVPPTEELALIHHNYANIDEFLEQIIRYSRIQSQQLVQNGYKFLWTDLIIRPVNEFLSQYFSRGGYKLGVHGLALAGLQSFSEFILYLRIWQSENFQSQNIPITQLSQTVRRAYLDISWWFHEINLPTVSPLRKLLIRLQRKIGL